MSDKEYNKSRYERKRKYQNKQQQKRRQYGEEYERKFGGNI